MTPAVDLRLNTKFRKNLSRKIYFILSANRQRDEHEAKIINSCLFLRNSERQNLIDYKKFHFI